LDGGSEPVLEGVECRATFPSRVSIVMNNYDLTRSILIPASNIVVALIPSERHKIPVRIASSETPHFFLRVLSIKNPPRIELSNATVHQLEKCRWIGEPLGKLLRFEKLRFVDGWHSVHLTPV